MENKSVAVVTGANGFVGSHLVDLLLEKGMKVKCITRQSSDLKWLKGKDVEINNCGLFDIEGMKKVVKGSNYIFHVAGVVKSKEAEGYFKGNVEPAKNLLTACLDSKDSIKKIVIVSSLTACGPSLDGIPVNEETIPHPITTYGKSKLAEEKAAQSFMKELPITICRAHAVYGERDTEIFIFFQTFNKGLMTTLGMKDKYLGLIHVKDLVNGLYLAAISEKSAGQIYFLSSEETYNWKQIGDITSKVLLIKPIKVKVPHFIVYNISAIAQFFSMFSSKPATLNLEKARDLVQPYWTCDVSKAVNELGYRQQISIEDGIKRTCDWYKEVGWLK
ncbi:MAG: NAD(P)-dependent oxidoreductase [Ignavibacteriales bacterium]|nr:NAD(P)-dependent oxidoreductase [Ignavibacteriales bacterium]